MSELEMICTQCDHTERGPDIPFPEDECPHCGSYMQKAIHFNEQESEAIKEILSQPRLVLPASPLEIED